MATLNPLPPILNKFNIDLAENAGSFMTAQDLGRASTACSDTKKLFETSLAEKREEELLKHVLKANPKKVKEILASIHCGKETKEVKECIVLKRKQGKEEYFSNSYQKMICIREWQSISPLEAAAWAGDNFLVQELLKHVPKELYPEAAKQLQAIRDRKDTEENGGYLAPFTALLKAYKEYTDRYNAPLDAQDDLKTLNELWLTRIGACQRRLSAYGLQEFCDKKLQNPIPEFKKEPERTCILCDNSEVDLDSCGSIYSLYKGWGEKCVGAEEWM